MNSVSTTQVSRRFDEMNGQSFLVGPVEFPVKSEITLYRMRLFTKPPATRSKVVIATESKCNAF